MAGFALPLLLFMAIMTAAARDWASTIAFIVLTIILATVSLVG